MTKKTRHLSTGNGLTACGLFANQLRKLTTVVRPEEYSATNCSNCRRSFFYDWCKAIRGNQKVLAKGHLYAIVGGRKKAVKRDGSEEKRQTR